MNQWVKKYKNEILVGIITSIIVTFIFKAGDIILAFAPNTGEKVIVALQSRLYKYAANQSSVSLLGNLFHIFIFLLLYVSMILIVKSIMLTREYDLTKSIKEAMENENKVEPEKKALLKKKYEKKQLRESRKNPVKTLKLLIVPVIVSTVLMIASLYTYVFMPVKLWHDFQIDIIQITPYCDLKTVNELQSKWVCMKSKEDYDAIKNVITVIQEENNLPSLPQK